jgi:hypothetical protein
MAPIFTGSKFGFGRVDAVAEPGSEKLNFVYFYSPGTWTIPADPFSSIPGGGNPGKVNVLVVGGGAGAGFGGGDGGGGGAGGFRYATNYTIPASPGTPVSVTVGTGGQPTLDYASGPRVGGSGGSSTFAPGQPYGISASGGGGGGQINNPSTLQVANPGGSGGGGTCGESGPGIAGGNGNVGGNVSSPPFSQAPEGNPGGPGQAIGPSGGPFASGGGGGAGGAGGGNAATNPATGGAGGIGALANMFVSPSLVPTPGIIYKIPFSQTPILIAPTYYAGGGGGGADSRPNAGLGGAGGGGNARNAGSNSGSPNGGTNGYGGGAGAPQNPRTRNVSDNPAQWGGHGCVIITYYTPS